MVVNSLSTTFLRSTKLFLKRSIRYSRIQIRIQIKYLHIKCQNFLCKEKSENCFTRLRAQYCMYFPRSGAIIV